MAFNFNKLVSGLPVVGGLFDDSEEKTLNELARNRALYEGIDVPELSQYSPELLQYLGDLRPESASYQTVQEDPGMKAAQASALAKMAGLAEEGLTLEDQVAFRQANQDAARSAQARSQSAIANAQARGISGSGLEFAMREMGNQEAANRHSQAGLEQAAQSARQRALYNQAYMQGLGNVRDQDFRAQSGNTDIINRFNQLNTQNRNAAQERNLNTRQQIGNQNSALRNDSQKYNNELKQNTYENQLRRAAGISGANTGMANAYAAQNASRQSDRNANTDLLFKSIFGV